MIGGIVHQLVLMLTTAAVLSAGAASASAYTAAIDPAGSIEVVSVGKVTVGGLIDCNFTFNGTLAMSAEIRQDAQFGSVTEVQISNCSGGEFSSVLGLSWELTLDELYASEEEEPYSPCDWDELGSCGSLPEGLSGMVVAMRDFSIHLSTFGGFVNCLWEGPVYMFMLLSEGGSGTYTHEAMFMLEEHIISFVRGSGLCPSSISLAGELSLAPDQEILIR